MSAEKDSSNLWVYDYALDKEGSIVAINYHIVVRTNKDSIFTVMLNKYCMAYDTAELAREGLSLHLSQVFPSLTEATAHAWGQKDKFSGGLD